MSSFSGGGGGGGGSGTVTHTIGALTLGAAVFGNGAADEKIDAAITTDFSGNLITTGNVTAASFITSGTAAGSITLKEAAAQGTNAIVLTAPSTAFSNVTFIIPSADGTATQFLKTDGAGTLSFATPAFTNISGVATAAQLPSPLSNFELVNAQVGTTYIVVAGDCGKLVTLNNASAIAVTLPAATGSFVAPCQIYFRNLGAGVATITPTGTIDGLASIGLPQFAELTAVSDSSNWQVFGPSVSVKNAALSVNTLQVLPSVTTAAVSMAPVGSDTNVGLTLKSKGTGTVTIQPGSNSAAAFTVANATSTGILRVDSTSARVGIGSAAPAADFDLHGKTQWDVNGLQTKYNNETTAGAGHQYVMGTVSNVTGISTTQAATNLIASTAAAGYYHVNVYTDLNAVCATPGPGQVSIVVNWTDASNARASAALVLAAAAAQATTTFAQTSLQIWSSTASAISYTPTVTACTTGTATYDIHAELTRTQ